jgi:hypothetical protein
MSAISLAATGGMDSSAILSKRSERILRIPESAAGKTGRIPAFRQFPQNIARALAEK